LVIHDESQTLTAKYAARAQQEDGPSSSTSLAPVLDSTSAFAFSINASRLDRNIEPQDWISPMIQAPSTSAEDQALCFFFGNYVSGSDMLNTCGNYQLFVSYLCEPTGREIFTPGGSFYWLGGTRKLLECPEYYGTGKQCILFGFAVGQLRTRQYRGSKIQSNFGSYYIIRSI
jgi:hypothetical protein